MQEKQATDSKVC